MNPQFVPDEVVTANKMNQLPKGVLGYAEITADVTGLAAGPTDITGLSVAVTLVAGRRIRVTVRCGSATAGTATERFQMLIREGTTQFARDLKQFPTNAAQMGYHLQAILTPAAGAHTYKASVTRISGTGTLTLSAASNDPAFILVEDIGAST